MMVNERQPAPNIMIVDDTPANVLLLVRMLTQRGYTARTMLSGEQALQAARIEPPDLILLDIFMPEMNGYEVCEQLKADERLKEIPVIFISALSETIDKVKAFKVGGVDYVTKPFHFEEVYARVQTHLRLRRLEKLREELTHMVIHDLQNPLTVICGFLDILEIREARTLSAGTTKLVAIARRSAEDLLNMIGSILDVSKMGAGEMKLQRESCNLYGLIRDIVATSQPLTGERMVEFELPESESPLNVTIDIGLIRRVIQNLLNNALKYTPDGSAVHVVVTPALSEVSIAVSDSGIGISPEFHQRIFEKFGQVGDRKNRRGTGLGLAFCKLAVEAHGGSIGVESDVGKGSIFWFTLPSLTKDLGISFEKNAAITTLTAQ